MIVLMSPQPAQLERLKEHNPSVPRWFAYPLIKASSEVLFSRSLSLCISAGLFRQPATPILAFNVGQLEAALAFLPFVSIPLYSLYQWRPPEQLGWIKRIIYHRVLKKSRAFVVYSDDTRKELKKRFPGKPITWIGHFTDTDFFDPARETAPVGDFLLCPGDHKRIEPIILKIATTLKIPIVRFSNDLEVLAFHAQNPNPYIKCLSKISFLEVRPLYHSARLVLNVVDDRYWPVGVTTFCEGLSMNKTVISSHGHSCSGYQFEDGSKPYFTVQDRFDENEWLAAISTALKSPARWSPGGSPRDMAVKYCSVDASAAAWRTVLSPTAR